MKASLWDGVKQISGELLIHEEYIEFIMSDFESTDLQLRIEREDIAQIKKYKVFDLAAEGIEVLSKGGGRNVFVVEESDPH